MKKLFIYFISIFFVLQVSLKSYSSNPKDFVKELVDDIINELSNENLNRDQKISFINKVALENVDIKALGFYTLGELRKSADKQNLEDYQSSFERYFLKSLSSRLSEYSKGRFEILGEDKKKIE